MRFHHWLPFSSIISNILRVQFLFLLRIKAWETTHFFKKLKPNSEIPEIKHHSSSIFFCCFSAEIDAGETIFFFFLGFNQFQIRLNKVVVDQREKIERWLEESNQMGMKRKESSSFRSLPVKDEQKNSRLMFSGSVQDTTSTSRLWILFFGGMTRGAFCVAH